MNQSQIMVDEQVGVEMLHILRGLCHKIFKKRRKKNISLTKMKIKIK